MQLESTILARLCELLGVEATELRVRRLPGGIGNRSFLLSGDRGQWAVRLPFGAAARQTLNHDTETRLLALVAEAGLTPEVLAKDAPTGFLITRYLEQAAAWTVEQSREQGNIERIAIVLRRLHRLPSLRTLPVFRPTLVARTYINASHTLVRRRGPSPEVPDEEKRWSVEFERLAQAHETAFSPTSICHNDLVAANILDDGQIWLVDFEYAVRSDPILDLAGLSGLNGYDPAQRRRLLDAYFQTKPTPITEAQLDEAIRLVRLMAYFWALTHAGGEASQDQQRFAAAMAAMLR